MLVKGKRLDPRTKRCADAFGHSWHGRPYTCDREAVACCLVCGRGLCERHVETHGSRGVNAHWYSREYDELRASRALALAEKK
jgi:hypothetical protein